MFKDRLFTFFILMACVYVITAHVVKREDSGENKGTIKKVDDLLVGLPLLGSLLGYLLSPILVRLDKLLG
ncbi:hypothetical protein KQX54_017498 [Cotesia glomerata]|uniref:Uncharacterized protein n=1 Tax=Cotesia glomerata TaxID=32391 RepID=A0AAV7I7E5_COTGL|nr:hypothetical protein KQX54_017498 [Cotesia glomerata]